MTTQTTVQTATARPLIPAMHRVWAQAEPFSDVIVRATAGLLLVPHGAQKLFGWFGGHGLEGTAGWLESIGFAPGLLFALGIGALEFFGGLMLALGLLTRPVAAAVLVFMVQAFFVHLPMGYAWNTGGFEMPLFWGLIALAVLIRGGGRYSLDRVIGREI